MIGKDCVCEVLKVEGQSGGGCACGLHPRIAVEGRACECVKPLSCGEKGERTDGEIGMG